MQYTFSMSNHLRIISALPCTADGEDNNSQFILASGLGGWVKIRHQAGTISIQFGNVIFSWSWFYSLVYGLYLFQQPAEQADNSFGFHINHEPQVKQRFITHQHFKHRLLIFKKIESGKEVALVAFSIVL